MQLSWRKRWHHVMTSTSTSRICLSASTEPSPLPRRTTTSSTTTACLSSRTWSTLARQHWSRPPPSKPPSARSLQVTTISHLLVLNPSRPFVIVLVPCALREKSFGQSSHSQGDASTSHLCHPSPPAATVTAQSRAQEPQAEEKIDRLLIVSVGHPGVPFPKA